MEKAETSKTASSKKMVNTKKIVFTAVFAALTCVATMFITIPTPDTQGYLNFGDSMVILCAFIFGPIPAMISGGLGSALADILLGGAIWAPFTLVIKGVEGLIVGFLAKSLLKRPTMNKLSILTAFISMIVGLLWMAFGYFLTDLILFKSWAIAIADVPNNLLQIAMAISIAFPIYIILTRNKVVAALRFMNEDYDKLASRGLNEPANQQTEETVEVNEKSDDVVMENEQSSDSNENSILD